MDGTSPPPLTGVYQQHQSQNVNPPRPQFGPVSQSTRGDHCWSQAPVDPSAATSHNGGVPSPPPRHMISPRARHVPAPMLKRGPTPWAQVVMAPDTPPAASNAPHQFARSFLQPQHQASPRASLDDLMAAEPLPQDDRVEPREDVNNYEEDLDTISVSSSVYRGHYEHGRRYAQDTNYIAPSDDKQFESMQAGHLMYTILDAPQRNPFFRSPIPEEGHSHIMDIGTGSGAWAVDVADRFQNYIVHGVDLYPPPQSWVPPNCRFEVDDVSRPWIGWNHKFRLIHIRLLLGAFSSAGWDRLYAEAYEHLEPGGWIEHLECDIDIKCEDGSLPPTSLLHTFGRTANDCANELGCPLTIYHEMRSRIERAGFVNIQEKVFKAPIGAWPSNLTYRDAGKCSLQHFRTGMSGWLLRLLTKYGDPPNPPWDSIKAQIWLAVLKRELDAGHHIYQNQRRVWAMKPY